MHSTVAAMSSEVPTVSIAYSDKTKGVFESAGLGNNVIDPRVLDTDETLERLKFLYSDKNGTKPVAGHAMDTVKQRAANQMREIVADVMQVLTVSA
jgi:polysaccharide pyruvyl transferase WcaK-like protein